ncbi:MAG: hypothetical protein JF588_21460 [Caulobacterales bacterium]|nr:hypothetical protein [Caulobacterales bacterium]
MSELEQLMAYVDGELDAADRAAFEARMAAEPELAAQVAAHSALADQIGRTYAPALQEEVPLRLRLAAQAANDGGTRRLAPWIAAAASLVIGVLAGQAIQPPPLAVGGAVPARLALAKALDRDLAADPGPVRIGLTFRDARGRYCRTFESAQDRLAGLACRDGARWRLETATAWAAAASQPDYRTAASETPPAVLAAVDAAMAGQALDAAQERAARDQGWRQQ